MPTEKFRSHGLVTRHRLSSRIVALLHHYAGGLRPGIAAPFGLRSRTAGAAGSHFHAADAAHHRARYRVDARIRLALSGIEYHGALYARVGPFRPARAAHLGGAAAYHHRLGRTHLDRHAYARSISVADADRCRATGSAQRRTPEHRSRRPRLEMAVHLSRSEYRRRERARGAGRRPSPLQDYGVVRDEFVLRPGAGRTDLCDAEHGDQPERGDQPAGRV